MTLRQITFIIMLINLATLFGELPVPALIFIFSILIVGCFSLKDIYSKVTKGIFIISLLFIQLIFYEKILSVESAISFFMGVAALKFWELNKEEDYFNMFLILTLAEASLFLIIPTSAIFLLGTVKLFVYFYFVIKMRQYRIEAINFKRVFALIVPSVLLALMLFISFPRFTRGFINAGNTNFLTTGHSSSINFNELGTLNPSTDMAFKVHNLSTKVNNNTQHYWRVSVLWQYNGKSWISANQNLKAPYQFIKNQQEEYFVELKAHTDSFLPILDAPSSLELIPFMYTSYLDGTFQLSSGSRIDKNYVIKSTYPTNFSFNNALMISKGLKINDQNLENIRARYLPNNLASRDQERLEQVLNAFKAKKFTYSLSPPNYKSMEDFLLNGTSGYCSHFAPSFAYLARLFNLPARVVTGYLGGELNPYDGSLIIRENDAHAWVEVFIEGKGWIRIDPTLLVAPERANTSATAFNDNIEPFFTIFNYQINRGLFRFGLLNESALLLDSLNSRFNNLVFNFDKEAQAELLGKLSKNRTTFTLLIFSVFAFFVICYALFLRLHKKHISAHLANYRRFLKKMEKEGISKNSNETASEFALRATQHNPQQSSYIQKETQDYIKFEYKN